MNGSLLLKKYRMTSPFGERIHPVTGIKSFHNGVDYATSGSPPIFAPFDGTVKKIGKDRYGANFIYIDFGKYIGLAYHCSKIVVKEKQKILKGVIFAYSGNTGRSTGEHLHWSWIKNNAKALDYYKADYIDWESDWMIDIRAIKVMVDGKEKTVNAINYKEENYVRLRDFDDVLGIAEVSYDPKLQKPIIED